MLGSAWDWCSRSKISPPCWQQGGIPTAWNKRGFETAPRTEKQVDSEKIKSLSKLLFNLKKTHKPGQRQRRALTLQKAHTLQNPWPEQPMESHTLQQGLSPCCAQRGSSVPSPAWLIPQGLCTRRFHPFSPELHSQPCSPFSTLLLPKQLLEVLLASYMLPRETLRTLQSQEGLWCLPRASKKGKHDFRVWRRPSPLSPLGMNH